MDLWKLADFLATELYFCSADLFKDDELEGFSPKNYNPKPYVAEICTGRRRR